MGHQIFFFSVTFITLVAFRSGAGHEVIVKIHERSLLACPAFGDPGNVSSVGWYRCSSDDCENHWDKFLIAHVKNMRETIADNPNFEVYTNGTLVIKEVLPMDDGKMFICIAKEKFIGKKRFTTILHIAEEPPELIPECPRLIHVIKGMDLHMDARVQGYPYPWVTWSHNGVHLRNTSNVSLKTRFKIRNVMLSESGRYTCHAKNPLGGDNFTVDVYVQDMQTPPSSPTSDIQTPSSSPTSETQSPSASPPPGKEDGNVFKWFILLFPLLIFIVGAISLPLVVPLVMRFTKPKDL